jgi:hypothetical protein
MSGGEGLRRKRPTRTTKGTLVQLNQQKVREKVLPNLSAALKATAMAMGSRWMDDDTVRSVGGSRMETTLELCDEGRSAQPWQERINSFGRSLGA